MGRGRKIDNDIDWNSELSFFDSASEDDPYNSNQKINALGKSMNLKNMSKIFIWYHHLSNSSSDSENIEFQKQRIEQSYPALFPTDMNKRNELHQKLKEAIYQSLYARTIDFQGSGNSAKATKEMAIKIGKKEFDQFSNPFKFPEMIDNLTSGFDSIEKG